MLCFSDVEWINIKLLLNHFPQGWQNSILCDHEDNLSDCIFKKILFSRFRKMSKNVCLSLKKFPTGLSNPHSFYVSRGTICGKKFFFAWKPSCVLFVIVGHWTKVFPFPVKIFHQGLRMSCIHVHNNLFMERYFEKKSFSNNFWLWSHYFGFLTELFRQRCQIRFHSIVPGTFRGKTFFLEKSILSYQFRTLGEIFCLFVKHFEAGCQNWVLRLRKSILFGFFLSEKMYIFHLFGTLSETFWSIW